MRTETSELNARENFLRRHSSPIPTAENEQFPHGWRYVKVTLPNGREDYKEVPLTAEDFLDPQLGDVMPQNVKHLLCTFDIFNALRNRYANDPTVAVLSDAKIQWGIPKLKEPAPDVCVIPNVKEKEPDLATFKVLDHGTRPCLVIEVMSPNYPGDDTHKVKIYQKAGVAEYIIVNPYNKRRERSYSLKGYRLVAGKYQRIGADAQGRLLSETTGVLFGVAADKLSVILWEARTGEKLLTTKEEQEARRSAQAQVQLESQARRAAEVQVQTEVQARREAEVQVQTEVQARREAEVQVQTEAQARREAEAKAQAAEQARLELAAQLQRLEARLRELETTPSLDLTTLEELSNLSD